MTRRFALTLFGVATLSAAAPHALISQGPPPDVEVGASARALVTIPAKSAHAITVTSPAFANLGDIPFENTQYKGNAFPGLAWSAGPAGTKSYVIIMQDGDGVRNGMPFLHWSMLNVSPSVTRLDAGMTTRPLARNTARIIVA